MTVSTTPLITPATPEEPLSPTLAPENAAPAVQDLPKAITPAHFKDRTPSNWVIRPEEGNIISAANSVSGELFRGTIAEFNNLMRPTGV